MTEQTKISALDWVKKDYVTPIELETMKGVNATVAVILGEVQKNVYEKYEERLISIQFSESKKIRQLKLTTSVLRQLIRSFGEYIDDWRGKVIRLKVEEVRGFETVGVEVSEDE